ncbi:MAG TPA: cache domain-containing protein, partial [Candidatus Saccharimonadia bacterium]|nr:cache domain-containing protein [Candidatus Saccharimonadia bacterium]
AGFLAVSLGFLVRATAVQTTTADSFAPLAGHVADILRALGYLSVLIGQFADPLQPRPKYEGDAVSEIAGRPEPKKHRGISLAVLTPGLSLLLPGLTALTGLMYLRRATTGLERHLLPVAWGFGGLTVFELLSDTQNLTATANPLLYQLAAPLGPLWWAALVALVVAAVILGAWVWQYLTKRLQSQLFMVLVSQALGLFLFTTLGFTFLVLRSTQSASLGDLSTASHVLQYAITSRQAETAAQAEAVAGTAGVAAAVTAGDHKALMSAIGDYLPHHSLTSLVVVNGVGQVVLRGEDPERYGDSRSSDPLVRRALIGEAASSVVVASGVSAPTVTLVAESPIRDADGNVAGAVIAGRAVSNAFVDGIKTSTGLDSAVYGGSIRAATTLVGSNGTDRAVGIAETTTAVTDQVLLHDKTYSGTVNFQNQPFLVSFAPLRDIDNRPIGMLLTARPAAALFATAYQSIQITFLFVVVLVIVSVYPIFRLSRYLARQLG